MEINKIYNEDCLVGMQRIPDGQIDAVICDLPYGSTSCAWDSVIPFEPLWEQYHRVCKPDAAIVLFGSEPFSTRLRMSNLKEFRYDWIWHKSSSGGFAMANRRPMKFHETISVFYREQPTYNPQYIPYAESTQKRFKDGDKVNSSVWQKEGKQNRIQGMHHVAEESPLRIKRGKHPESILEFRSVPNTKRVHPTQKPVDLLRYLVRTYTNEGDTVLDNCIGSGMTALACIRENRNFIGFEVDQECYAKACEIIGHELEQPKLF